MKKLTGERNTMYLSNGGKSPVLSVHLEGIKNAQCTASLYISVTEGKLQFYFQTLASQLQGYIVICFTVSWALHLAPK